MVGTVSIVMFAAFGLAVAGAIGMSLYLERRRQEEVRHAAARMGLQFQANGPDVLEHLQQLPYFRQGHAQLVRNVLRGHGEAEACFDYRYTIGYGKQSRTYRQTIAAFRLPGRTLPEFAMRPEGFFDRVGEFFGYRDIDFDQSSEFSQAYFLKAQDVPAVRALFQGGAVPFFARRHGWVVEGGRDELIVLQAGKLIPGDGLRRFLEESAEIARLFR